MEPRPLTTWEQKERDGLLALETDEWRQKRRIAEDPNTTAEVLERLANEVVTVWKANLSFFAEKIDFAPQFAPRALFCQQNEPANYVQSLLIEALVAHPNMSARAMLRLIHGVNKCILPLHHWSLAHNVCSRGLCVNPVSTLVVLKEPEFWHLLGEEDCLTLLREGYLPPQVAAALTHHGKISVKEAALLHVSCAGQLQTAIEGQVALTRFWKTYRPEESLNREILRERLALVYCGLAPLWAADTSANKPQMANIFGRLGSFAVGALRVPTFALLARWLAYSPSSFVRFVINLRGVLDGKQILNKMGTSNRWKERLNAALVLPLSSAPFPDDHWNRSPHELLEHLVRDGNRFVRWAAQTRLADPDFVFTWHEGE